MYACTVTRQQKQQQQKVGPLSRKEGDLFLNLCDFYLPWVYVYIQTLFTPSYPNVLKIRFSQIRRLWAVSFFIDMSKNLVYRVMVWHALESFRNIWSDADLWKKQIVPNHWFHVIRRYFYRVLIPRYITERLFAERVR